MQSVLGSIKKISGARFCNHTFYKTREVPSIKKLALLSAELGLRIAEFKGFEKKDFPGETFGEYRTRQLVLEAWDRLEAK